MEMLKVRDPNVLAIRVSFFCFMRSYWHCEPLETQLLAAENFQRCNEIISKYPRISRNAVKRVVRVGRAGQLPPIAVRGC